MTEIEKYMENRKKLYEWDQYRVKMVESWLYYLSNKNDISDEFEEVLDIFYKEVGKWGQSNIWFDTDHLYCAYYEEQEPYPCFREEGIDISMLPYSYEKAAEILKNNPIKLPMRVGKYTIMNYEYYDYAEIIGEGYEDIKLEFLYFSNRFPKLIPKIYLRWLESKKREYWLAYIKFPIQNIFNKITWYFRKVILSKNSGYTIRTHAIRTWKKRSEEHLE